MSKITYKMSANVTVYPGMGSWRFLALPKEIGIEIKTKFGKRSVGWGSLRVLANIGKTSWKTSIFPDRKAGTYLLPLKATVRKAENIADGAKVIFTINL